MSVVWKLLKVCFRWRTNYWKKQHLMREMIRITTTSQSARMHHCLLTQQFQRKNSLFYSLTQTIWLKQSPKNSTNLKLNSRHKTAKNVVTIALKMTRRHKAWTLSASLKLIVFLETSSGTSWSLRSRRVKMTIWLKSNKRSYKKEWQPNKPWYKNWIKAKPI